MREIIREAVPEITAPALPDRIEAQDRQPDAQAHAQYQATWPALNTVELVQPPQAPPSGDPVVTAWNLERCKAVEDSAVALIEVGADIVLATEMDIGMARSGQRHTVRDLAVSLGMGYVFGTEFVELGYGDPYETRLFEGTTNDHGLHGNAILSRWPLLETALIPLDPGGAWYTRAPKGDKQGRIGGRNAIAGRIEIAGTSLWLVSTHYESESDADGRAAQTRILLNAIDDLTGGSACVIGGDLNTGGFSQAGMSGAEILSAPETVEPTFAAMADAGFDWRTANTGRVTTRVPPERPARYPLKRLDWLFTRGVVALDPFVRAAISDRGAYLSDHELIGTTVRL